MKKILMILTLGVLVCLLGSCARYTSRYKITDENYKTYYTNDIKLSDSTVTFDEYNRNNIKYTYTLFYPYKVLDNTVPNKETRKYIRELREQGYSKAWATHKALVECGQIPEDDEYLAIQED